MTHAKSIILAFFTLRKAVRPSLNGYLEGVHGDLSKLLRISLMPNIPNKLIIRGVISTACSAIVSSTTPRLTQNALRLRLLSKVNTHAAHQPTESIDRLSVPLNHQGWRYNPKSACQDASSKSHQRLWRYMVGGRWLNPS